VDLAAGALAESGWSCYLSLGLKENTMKSLLFGAVIVMMSLPVAYAWEPPSQAIGDRTDKWAGSSAYSLPCHLVKERIGTRHGHPVYQTRQVCG
jgi:hypothetical protein